MLNVDLCMRLPTCTRMAGSVEHVDTSLDQEDISSPLFQDNAESGCTDVRRVQQDFKYFKAYETLKRPWSRLADLKDFPLRRIRSYHRNPRLESLESDPFDMRFARDFLLGTSPYHLPSKKCSSLLRDMPCCRVCTTARTTCTRLGLLRASLRQQTELLLARRRHGDLLPHDTTVILQHRRDAGLLRGGGAHHDRFNCDVRGYAVLAVCQRRQVQLPHDVPERRTLNVLHRKKRSRPPEETIMAEDMPGPPTCRHEQ